MPPMACRRTATRAAAEHCRVARPQAMRPMTPSKSQISRHPLANLLHPPYTAQSQS